ncbi:hypothetical protein ACFVQB_23700 [Paenibacillus sp. NPDC057886]|uniref:hypothetical protein n=1 Tax=Paenibacillus sp. NPDC057886 TaxID=3346270 RepID=UPI003688C7A5
MVKKKRFTTVLVILSLFASVLAGSAAAEDQVIELKGANEQEINTYLKNAGYTQEVIDTLELYQKNYLYEEEATFTAHKNALGQLTETQEGISEDFRLMALPNWNHSLVVSQVKAKTGYVDFIFSYNWDWSYDPVFTSEEKFGIAWTDGFHPDPSTAKYSYQARGKQDRPTAYPGCPATRTNGGTVWSGYSTYNPGAGIGWAINLIGSWWTQDCGYYTVNGHKGSGQVKAGKAHNNNNGPARSSAVGKYYHKTFAANGELGFSGVPTISISPSSNYDPSDEVGTRWDWVHKNY